MRPTPSSMLLILLLAIPFAHAEEQADAPAAPAPVESLEQRLLHSEQLRGELQASQANGAAQTQRLRQENQRLRLQLKEVQAQIQPKLLSEEQTWFALGAGLSLASVLFGALLRGKRKTRREWIN